MRCADGVAEGTIRDHLIKLDGPFSVISRSFMVRPALRGPSPSPHLHLHLPTSPPPHQVHADPDDLGKGDNSEPGGSGVPPTNGKASLVTGNAGARIACGEIKAA